MQKVRPLSRKNKTALLSWYDLNGRPLPWRVNRDPYRIWLSETMLQQTTVTAVIPYFEKFLNRFPDLTTLAQASEDEVREQWAGLGYYSRASNLWKAARTLVDKGGFPTTHAELGELPGFGPYTSRAVASLAFGEAVGVLDGNVIRVLSRFHAWPAQWWRPSSRRQLQEAADQWVQDTPSEKMNQAMMELGATLCTPKNPTCLLCPLHTDCQGLKERKILNLPLPKPRRSREIWLWEVHLRIKKGRVALCSTHQLPFLKGHLMPPGEARQLKTKPKRFHFTHTVTHHDIFVRVLRPKTSLAQKNVKWIELAQVSRHSPAALLKKVLERQGCVS